MTRKILSLVLSLGLLFQQVGYAAIAELNIAGQLALMRPYSVVDQFRPIHLRYFSYDMNKDSFRLFLDKGDTKNIAESALKTEAQVLYNYFLVGISLPDDAFWVNLRPDAADQIIDPYLAQTDIGKVLLEADLQLKKDTASFTSPQTPEGKAYWDKLYKKAGEIFGSESVTIPTLTRPWIVPGEIIIRETKESGYIYKANLKVMLESDYLQAKKDEGGKRKEESLVNNVYQFSDPRLKALNEYSTEIIRETIIPKLTKEVNTSKRYANLRQVYYSLILARWFKSRFSPVSLRGVAGAEAIPNRINSHNLTGLTSTSSWSKMTYFNAYKKSFAEGEYNIKEPAYAPYGQVIRSYFSGGVAMGPEALVVPGPGRPAPSGAGIVAAGSEAPLLGATGFTGAGTTVQDLSAAPAQPRNADGTVAPKPGKSPEAEPGAITVTGAPLTYDQHALVNRKIAEAFVPQEGKLITIPGTIKPAVLQEAQLVTIPEASNVEVYVIPGLEECDNFLVAHPGRGGGDHSKRRVYLSPARFESLKRLSEEAKRQFWDHEIGHLMHPDLSEEQLQEAYPIDLVIKEMKPSGQLLGLINGMPPGMGGITPDVARKILQTQIEAAIDPSRLDQLFSLNMEQRAAFLTLLLSPDSADQTLLSKILPKISPSSMKDIFDDANNWAVPSVRLALVIRLLEMPFVVSTTPLQQFSYLARIAMSKRSLGKDDLRPERIAAVVQHLLSDYLSLAIADAEGLKRSGDKSGADARLAGVDAHVRSMELEISPSFLGEAAAELPRLVVEQLSDEIRSKDGQLSSLSAVQREAILILLFREGTKEDPLLESVLGQLTPGALENLYFAFEHSDYTRNQGMLSSLFDLAYDRENPPSPFWLLEYIREFVSQRQVGVEEMTSSQVIERYKALVIEEAKRARAQNNRDDAEMMIREMNRNIEALNEYQPSVRAKVADEEATAAKSGEAVPDDEKGWDGSVVLPGEIRAALEEKNFAAFRLIDGKVSRTEFLYSDGRAATTIPVYEQKVTIVPEDITNLQHAIKESGIADSLEAEEIVIIVIPGQKAHYSVGRPQIYLDTADLQNVELLKDKLRHEFNERRKVLQGLEGQEWTSELARTRYTPGVRSRLLQRTIVSLARLAHLDLLEGELDEIDKLIDQRSYQLAYSKLALFQERLQNFPPEAISSAGEDRWNLLLRKCNLVDARLVPSSQALQDARTFFDGSITVDKIAKLLQAWNEVAAERAWSYIKYSDLPGIMNMPQAFFDVLNRRISEHVIVISQGPKFIQSVRRDVSVYSGDPGCQLDDNSYAVLEKCLPYLEDVLKAMVLMSGDTSMSGHRQRQIAFIRHQLNLVLDPEQWKLTQITEEQLTQAAIRIYDAVMNLKFGESASDLKVTLTDLNWGFRSLENNIPLIWMGGGVPLDMNPSSLGTQTPRVQTPARAGGIDFRTMNIITQPMGTCAGLNYQLPRVKNAEAIDLDKEFGQIKMMVERGIVPSAERIKEFMAACYERNEFASRRDDMISCLIEVCQLEESQVMETPAALRECLVIVDSDKLELAKS